MAAKGFSSGMMRSSGGGSMNDDEFLPDFEEKELTHQQKMDSSIVVTKKPDSMLRHNEEHSGIMYKYDLPIENKPIPFKSQLIEQQEIPNTAVENLYESLEVDKETAYESFIIKLNQNYNNEIDMYGDIRKAGDNNLKVSQLAS